MQLDELFLDRQLYRAKQVMNTQGADYISSNVAQPPSTAVASGNTVYDINTNSLTINGAQLTPGTFPQTVLDVGNWGWTQTSVFTVLDADTIQWGAGTFTSADGITVLSIVAGNTGNMAAATYVYLDLAVSVTAYQITTNVTAPVGIGKVLIAVCQNGGTTATFNLVQAHQIIGDNILANTINASKIMTGQLIVGTNVGLGTAQTAGNVTTIIGNTVTTGYVNALGIVAGSVDAANITGTTITGLTLQTATSGQRIVISQALGEILLYDANGNSQGEMYGASSGGGIFYLRGASSIVLSASNTSIAVVTPAGFEPQLNNTFDLGSSSKRWANIWGAGQASFDAVVTSTFVNYTKSSFVGSVYACPLPTILDSLEVIRRIPEPVQVGNRGHYGDGLYFDDLTFPIEALWEEKGKMEIEHTHMIGLLMQAVRQLTKKVDDLELLINKTV